MLSRWIISLMVMIVWAEVSGITVNVRNKMEFLRAVEEASDGQGRLNQDLIITFAADCDSMIVEEAEMWNASAKCILDCKGRRICWDAGRCPSGTVVIRGDPENGRVHERVAAIKGCGKGSLFNNLTIVNHGHLEFDSPEDTLVKDCDFINCGASTGTRAVAGGAIRGCGIVMGCGFESCRAHLGGALNDCGYVCECLFLDCNASDGGGAIAGMTDVSRCEFRGCSSGTVGRGFGGAVYGGYNIVSSLFVDCSARQGGAIMSAGRTDGSRTMVAHCTFIRCRGEGNDEAVYENAEGLPVFMLSCLGYGCGLWQDGVHLEEKHDCHRLADTTFFRDYDNGDFHPNPALSEDWMDPCGLRFGDSGSSAAVFVCRDLDGYGYQLSSPWPVCPGCYRFRTDTDRARVVTGVSDHPPKYVVVKHRESANPGHWRVPQKKSIPIPGFGNSVRNRLPRAVGHRTGSALLDLSALPCEIMQNEILHEGDNPLMFVSPWYEWTLNHSRFFDLCGPLKMPEIGVDPGYGRPGEMFPYEEDNELKRLNRRYGFRPGWFQFGRTKDGNEVVERIPFLFSQVPGKGKFPLVVYVAGKVGRGTDLKKMFRQTGVFDAVREPSFFAEHPCHLLAIMPPAVAHGYFVSYPHSYRLCRGDGGLGIGNLQFVRAYADLVFAIQRELEATGTCMVDPDAIILVGLGTGATAAVTMMCEYPGRYAGACATCSSSPWLKLPTFNRYRPGRWWFAMTEASRAVDDRSSKMVEAYKKSGAEVRLSYYQDGVDWWNRHYASPEFKEWLANCFARGPLHGEKLVIARPEPVAGLLMAKTGADEVTYYGTTDERPEGLPREVADKRVADLRGIRYLYIDGKVGNIPCEAFVCSPDLETVHVKMYCATNAENKVLVKCNMTNISERAFADSPKLKLVVFDNASSIRIAPDAFDGCVPSLYGATQGIPVSISYGFRTGTNYTVRMTKKVELDAHALPVDGLFNTHIFICDDQLNRRLHIEGDFLWSEEAEGANALMCLGEGRDVFVPETLGGRPVVALGRWLLHRRGGFEYGTLAIPATVRTIDFSPCVPKVRKVFAPGELKFGIRHALAPDTVVYRTTPHVQSHRLVPSPICSGCRAP